MVSLSTVGWKTGEYSAVVGAGLSFGTACSISNQFLLRMQATTSPNVHPSAEASSRNRFCEYSGVFGTKLSAVPECEIIPATMGSFRYAYAYMSTAEPPAD